MAGTLGNLEIEHIVDAMHLGPRSIDMDEWLESGPIFRRIVALNTGEEQPTDLTWPPPPHGFRYETDSEFRNRIAARGAEMIESSPPLTTP